MQRLRVFSRVWSWLWLSVCGALIVLLGLAALALDTYDAIRGGQVDVPLDNGVIIHSYPAAVLLCVVYIASGAAGFWISQWDRTRKGKQHERTEVNSRSKENPRQLI